MRKASASSVHMVHMHMINVYKYVGIPEIEREIRMEKLDENPRWDYIAFLEEVLKIKKS